MYSDNYDSNGYAVQILALCVANAWKGPEVLIINNVARVKSPHPAEVAAVADATEAITAPRTVCHLHGGSGIEVEGLILMRNFCKLEEISIRAILLHRNM